MASPRAWAARPSVRSSVAAASTRCRCFSASGPARATCRRWRGGRSRSGGVSSRADFLTRIRREMAKTRGLFPAAPAERPVRPGERLDLLRRELSERWLETLERFRAEFERVAGIFHRVPTAADVPAELERICRAVTARRVVAWSAQELGVAVAPTLDAAGIAVESMPGGTVSGAERGRLRAVVAEADLGVTGADLAVA